MPSVRIHVRTTMVLRSIMIGSIHHPTPTVNPANDSDTSGVLLPTYTVCTVQHLASLTHSMRESHPARVALAEDCALRIPSDTPKQSSNAFAYSTARHPLQHDPTSSFTSDRIHTFCSVPVPPTPAVRAPFGNRIHPEHVTASCTASCACHT